jgi:hypothetical protein
MRLQVLLPKVDPQEISIPVACVYADCASKDVQLHHSVQKALRDTMHTPLQARLAGHGGFGGVSVQNRGVRGGAGGSSTHPRSETRAGLWGRENPSARRRCDERDMWGPSGCIS